MIKNIKNAVLHICVISDFNGQEIVGTLYEKEFQKNKSRRIWN